MKIVVLKDMQDQAFIDEFVSLPSRFRSREYQVGLTPPEMVKHLMHWGHQLGSRFWMIKDENDRTILRISARKCPQFSDVGTMGFFEIDLEHPRKDEALDLSLQEAEAWLKQNGVKEVVTPIDLNTWFNYRFSIPGKKFFPRMRWEPTTPPDYLSLFEKRRYSTHSFFHTIFFPHIGWGEFIIGAGPMKRSYQRILKQGFKLRPFDQENFMTKEIPLFHEISHEAFADSSMFEAIDLETFRSLYATAVKKYDFTPSSVLISPEGEEAGFIFAFFDGDYLVIKSIAIKKKFQGMRLSSGMIWNAVKQSVPLKKKGTISALVRTGLASELIEKNVKKTMWFSWAHYYKLVKKDLA